MQFTCYNFMHTIMEREDFLETGQTKKVGEPRAEALPEAVTPIDDAQSLDSAVSVSAANERELDLPAGTSRVRLRLIVPRGARLQVDVEARAEGGRLLGLQSLVFGDTMSQVLPLWPGAQLAGWARSVARTLPQWLVWLALGIYAFTRLYALPAFPIYFFTDEAIQTVTAADLLRDHFHSPTGELLPTYFANGTQYNLSTSVYLQVVPYLLFGGSVWQTRGVAALMTLLAAASVGLILKRVFKSPYPWLAVMILSITPAWFLHSRTAFETGLAVSFYAAFLYCYMMYRAESPRYLYGAVVMGALAFYSYTPVRMIMLVTALLLFFSDIKYHGQHWRVILPGLGLALLLALPFVRFLINHPDATEWQMRLLGSYWIYDIPLQEKLKDFFTEYLHGLDPLYWYLPHTQDLPRHTMLDYGHLLRQTIPLGLLGIGVALGRFRSSAHRTLLIAVLAAPSGAALVKLGITRALVMVIPMAILTALGIALIMDWLHQRRHVSQALLSVGVFVLLAGVNLYMLRDALVNGPLWYRDYSLTGMQYGGEQIFGEVKQYLQAHPKTHIILSPSWANGTDVVARFFFPDAQPFELGSIVGYFDEVRPMQDDTLFIMIPEEFDQIPKTRFTDIRVEKTLNYPDGRPGFYFVRLKYVPNIEQVIAQEESARRQMATQSVMIDGQAVDISYSALDMGKITDLFDSNPDTLIRSWAINPMKLSFSFSKPRPLQLVTLRVGGAATLIHMKVWTIGQEQPVEMDQNLPEAPQPRDARLEITATSDVTRIEFEIANTNDPPNGNVHLWGVTFK